MRLILTILCAALLMSACEKEQHEEIRKFISFETDSIIFEGEDPNAIITVANLTDTDPNNDMDKLVITVDGYAEDQLIITLLGNNEGITKSTFHSSDGNSLLRYSKISNITQIANQELGTFSLEITNVQDRLIEGNFYAMMIDTSGVLPPTEARHGFIRAIVKAAP